MFLILIFGVRFFIEFLKEPQVGFESNMALNMGQLLSIPFILAGIYLVIRSQRVKAGG
jgi:prolipoprotein diacylglyceryltransferase